MNTPYRRKFAMLAGALLRSPGDIPGWAGNLPLWGRTPLQVGLPWWSYAAIRQVGQFLQPQHQVFEYGSGGSSLYLARRAARVLAVENDAAWHRLVCSAALAHGLPGLECELHPLRDDSLDSFRQSSFSQRIRSQLWDVVVVDCHCGFNVPPYGVIRPAAFSDALDQIRPGGLLVLDDSWMFPELLQPRPGWSITDYQGVGPCRYGVTSTAVLQRDPIE
jgi:hypothetical protein